MHGLVKLGALWIVCQRHPGQEFTVRPRITGWNCNMLRGPLADVLPRAVGFRTAAAARASTAHRLDRWTWLDVAAPI